MFAVQGPAHPIYRMRIVMHLIKDYFPIHAVDRALIWLLDSVNLECRSACMRGPLSS